MNDQLDRYIVENNEVFEYDYHQQAYLLIGCLEGQQTLEEFLEEHYAAPEEND